MPAERRPSATRTGRRRHVRYLTELELAYVVFELAAQFFPAESYGTPMPEFQLDDDEQSVSRLQSAIYLPMQPYYRTVYDKAACLFRSLVKNHPLKDGNKRLGVVALDVFLRTNGIDFKATQDEVVNAALVIAKHPGNFPLREITRWIRGHCVGRPRGFVRRLADQWEERSRAIMVRARQDDMRIGRSARIPGRRIRLPRRMQDEYGPVKGLPGGKIVLRGGPRDGELVNLPFVAQRGVVASGVHPDDLEVEPAKQRRVLYEVLEETRRRRKVGEYRGIEEPGSSVQQLPLI